MHRLYQILSHSVGIRLRSAARVASIASCLLAGCATSQKVTVDAIARPKAEEAISYRIVPAKPELTADELRYKEAVRIVRTTLAAKGMYESPDPAKADMEVILDYGISERMVRVETLIEPEMNLMGFPRVRDPANDKEVGVEVGYYEKHLVLTARQGHAAANGAPAEALWSIDLETEGPNPDLRKVLPVLAGTGIDYIGRDTDGKITVKVKENDGAVEFVKRESMKWAASANL